MSDNRDKVQETTTTGSHMREDESGSNSNDAPVVSDQEPIRATIRTRQIGMKLGLVLAVFIALAFISMPSVMLAFPLPFVLLRWKAPLYGLSILYLVVGLLLTLAQFDPFSSGHDKTALIATFLILGDAAFSACAAWWIAWEVQHREDIGET